MASFDLIIRGGTILDGLARESYQADVGVVRGEIKAVGNLSKASGRKIIEAEGKFVCPGFVDIQNHSDSYLTLLEIPTLQSLVNQGITTIAVGHCGTSLAPLSSVESLKSVQKWHSLAGANINWQSFAEYFTALQKYPLGVNVLSLVGHATMRRGLLSDQVRSATAEESEIIGKLVRESLAAGAAGLSLGLVYAHEADASLQELMLPVKIVGGAGRLVSVHLRSEGAHLIDALNEVITLAHTASARLKISHFKIRGSHNFPFADQALGILDMAYQNGLDVFFDVYPYTTSWNVLYTYLPKWAYEGGKNAILKNIRDPQNRPRILTYLQSQEQDLGKIFIAGSQNSPSLVGKNLQQLASNQEIGVEEALLNALEATGTQVVVFDHNLSSEIMERFLQHPLSVIATDGAGYDLSYSPTHGLVHPRCFGAMPKFLSMVREKKIMSWSEAIKKITSRPAEKLGIKDRGRLAKGMAADVVVFDPRDIGSQATYENPYQESDGIEHVLVNGKISFSARQAVDPPSGSILRL